jgi:hypothetical protein
MASQNGIAASGSGQCSGGLNVSNAEAMTRTAAVALSMRCFRAVMGKSCISVFFRLRAAVRLSG